MRKSFFVMSSLLFFLQYNICYILYFSNISIYVIKALQTSDLNVANKTHTMSIRVLLTRWSIIIYCVSGWFKTKWVDWWVPLSLNIFYKNFYMHINVASCWIVVDFLVRIMHIIIPIIKESIAFLKNIWWLQYYAK